MSPQQLNLSFNLGFFEHKAQTHTHTYTHVHTCTHTWPMSNNQNTDVQVCSELQWHSKTQPHLHSALSLTSSWSRHQLPHLPPKYRPHTHTHTHTRWRIVNIVTVSVPLSQHRHKQEQLCVSDFCRDQTVLGQSVPVFSLTLCFCLHIHLLLQSADN